MLLGYLLFSLGWMPNMYVLIYFSETYIDFIVLMFFTHRLEKYGKKTNLYLGIAFLVMLGFSFALGALRNINPNSFAYRTFATLFIYLELLGTTLACYKERSLNSILGWTTTLIIRQICDDSATLLSIGCGVNPRLSILLVPDASMYINALLYDVIRISFLIMVYLPFRKSIHAYDDKKTAFRVIVYTVLVLLMMTLIETAIVTYADASIPLYACCLIALLALCISLLMVRTDILTESKYRQEAAIMNQVLASESQQYNSLKTNIEVINMKAHDIKHQLEKYQDKLTEEEVNRLKKAVESYDLSLKTGNSVLDTVIYSASLRASKMKIRLTCLADGKALNGYDDAMLYYLFSNIFDNAFEAVKDIKDPEKRLISLNVKEEGNKIHIEECNYFLGSRVIENGLIRTSKEDSRHHGYGLKSIRFLVEQNHGTTSLKTDEDMFFLLIDMPKSSPKPLLNLEEI